MTPEIGHFCLVVALCLAVAQSFFGLAVAMTVFLFSLAGVPPMLGFFGKFYVLRAAYEAGLAWLAVAGVIASVIGAFYYLRVIVAMYMREPQGEVYEGDNLQIGLAMALVAVLILWIGISPGPVAELARQGTAALAGSF